MSPEDEALRAALDPDIAGLVMDLRRLGWSTLDSGDGHSKGADPSYAAGTWSTFPHVISELPDGMNADDAARAYASDCARLTGRTWTAEVMSCVCAGPDGAVLDIPGRSHRPLLFGADLELYDAAPE
jgi:hypothetical protein